MRHLSDPLEQVDNAGTPQGVSGTPLGFRETAPRWKPTHKGELTERRTPLVQVTMTPSSVRRLARYLRC
jgi:hypothetical protein